MERVLRGVVAPGVGEVLVEVDVVPGGWVVAAQGQVRAENVPVLRVVRGWHTGQGFRATTFPVPDAVLGW
ncbi:MAG: hypothetical protein ACOC6A_02835 [Chloroflexota bacterium]